MLKVALTGSIGSGKTTLARIWAAEGVALVLADDLARRVVEPGTPGLRAVVEEFGEGLLTEGGSLDRGALRALVFRDEGKRRRLEAILHPLISSLREAWIREQEEAGATMTVSEIPLLFEVGLEREFHRVVVVDAPTGERRRRLREDRGLDDGEVGRIMEAQMSSEEKRRRADFVVDNSGSLEDLRIRALALLDLLRAQAARRRRR